MGEYHNQYGDQQLTEKLRIADASAFMWNTHNLPNGSVGAIGSFLEDVTGAEQHITSTVVANISRLVTCNRHLVFNVTTVTTAGKFRVTGNKVDESDGSTSPHQEVVEIDSVGYYQTDAKWMGDLTVVALTTGDIVTRFNSLTYYDAGNNDFAIVGARGSWTPGQDAWTCTIKLLKVLESGEVVNLTQHWQFSSGATIPRAYKNVQGNCKVTLSEAFLGSNNEGLIILIDNISNIRQGGVILQIKGVDPTTSQPFDV